MDDSSADQLKAKNGAAPSAAVQRMTRSRNALRQVLQTGQTDGPIGKQALGDFSGGLFASLKSLKDNPSAQLLLSAANQMWAKNPWRLLVLSAMQAADVVLKPVAKRNPIALIAGAAAIGAVLALVRPWRLIKKSALLSALLGR